MAEHIKISPQEAKKKVAALRKVVLDLYDGCNHQLVTENKGVAYESGSEKSE